MTSRVSCADAALKMVSVLGEMKMPADTGGESFLARRGLDAARTPAPGVTVA